MTAPLESSHSFCRVCMDTFSTHIDFGTAFSDGSELLTYLDCFEFVTHIEIDLSTNLQQHLCTKCAAELKSAFEFIRKAEQAEKRIRESIENIRLAGDELLEDLFDTVNETGTGNKSLNELNTIEGHESELENLSIFTDLELETQSNKSEVDFLVPIEQFSTENQSESNTECHSKDEEHSINVVSATVEELYCRQCDKTFKNRRSLYQHQNRFHQTKTELKDLDQTQESTTGQNSRMKYHCNKCSKSYKTLSLLKTHLKYHERKQLSQKSEACSICDKRFATSFYLRQHTELIHANKRPQLACDQCDKIYMTKNALQNHKRVHTGQTVECDECGKSFLNSYELKIHLRFHAGDYPYQCKICEKKFAIKGHLRTHMWQHEGLKLQCVDCGKLFTSTKSLLEHSYSHAEKMPFPCCYCSKSYPSKQKYKIHLKTIHMADFDEMEHLTATNAFKLTLRNKKLPLVQADSIMKEIEIASKGSEDTIDMEIC